MVSSVYGNVHRHRRLGRLPELYDPTTSLSLYRTLILCTVTNPATTELLYRDRIALAKRFSRSVRSVDETFDRAGSSLVTAALCSYGVPIMPAPPMPSPNYDVSAAYPLINTDRNASAGANVRYVFDSDVPAGRVEAIPTPQTTFGYPSSTPRPPTPRPNWQGNSGGSDKGSQNRRNGIIVASVFGALIVLCTLIALIIWQGKREAKRMATDARRKVTSKPAITRQLSILERGDAPPAYEDIDTTTRIDPQGSNDAPPRHRRSW